jgi:hypothetical protein
MALKKFNSLWNQNFIISPEYILPLPTCLLKYIDVIKEYLRIVVLVLYINHLSRRVSWCVPYPMQLVWYQRLPNVLIVLKGLV